MPDAWTVAQTARVIEQYGLDGPVLDVGTGVYAEWFRPHVTAAGLVYVTLDQEPHDGIDIVCRAGGDEDLPDRYPTILLLSILEHTPEPPRVIHWVVRHLLPGGHLLVAAPCAWAQHDFPADYWRILPDGARWLLRELEILELVLECGPDLSQRNQLFAVARKHNAGI